MLLHEVMKIWQMASGECIGGQASKFKLYMPFNWKPLELFKESSRREWRDTGVLVITTLASVCRTQRQALCFSKVPHKMEFAWSKCDETSADTTERVPHCYVRMKEVSWTTKCDKSRSWNRPLGWASILRLELGVASRMLTLLGSGTAAPAMLTELRPDRNLNLCDITDQNGNWFSSLCLFHKIKCEESLDVTHVE